MTGSESLRGWSGFWSVCFSRLGSSWPSCQALPCSGLGAGLFLQRQVTSGGVTVQCAGTLTKTMVSTTLTTMTNKLKRREGSLNFPLASADGQSALPRLTRTGPKRRAKTALNGTTTMSRCLARNAARRLKKEDKRDA